MDNNPVYVVVLKIGNNGTGLVIVKTQGYFHDCTWETLYYLIVWIYNDFPVQHNSIRWMKSFSA